MAGKEIPESLLKLNADGPAFPNTYTYYPGLTKREYMATAALQGLLVANLRLNIDERVKFAVKAADDLIKLLAETSQ